MTHNARIFQENNTGCQWGSEQGDDLVTLWRNVAMPMLSALGLLDLRNPKAGVAATGNAWHHEISWDYCVISKGSGTKNWRRKRMLPWSVMSFGPLIDVAKVAGKGWTQKLTSPTNRYYCITYRNETHWFLLGGLNQLNQLYCFDFQIKRWLNQRLSASVRVWMCGCIFVKEPTMRYASTKKARCLDLTFSQGNLPIFSKSILDIWISLVWLILFIQPIPNLFLSAFSTFIYYLLLFFLCIHDTLHSSQRRGGDGFSALVLPQSWRDKWRALRLDSFDFPHGDSPLKVVVEFNQIFWGAINMVFDTRVHRNMLVSRKCIHWYFRDSLGNFSWIVSSSMLARYYFSGDWPDTHRLGKRGRSPPGLHDVTIERFGKLGCISQIHGNCPLGMIEMSQLWSHHPSIPLPKRRAPDGIIL